MSQYLDKDGIDGPFDRAMAQAMRDDDLAFPKPAKTLPAERRRVKAQSASERSRLEAVADRLCGELVKRLAGHRCEAKGVAGISCSRTLDWVHGIGRTKDGTRWAHANTYCLCRAHHDYFGHHSSAFERWRVEHFGAELLDRMAKQARPTWRGDIQSVIESLRAGVFIQGER